MLDFLAEQDVKAIARQTSASNYPNDAHTHARNADT